MADGAERQQESKRILDRIAREAGSDAATVLGGTAHEADGHLAARGADPNDSIELWGTRIGHILGLVITIGVLAWLVLYLLRG